MIKKLKIKNFKRIHEVNLGELTNINYIVGFNDSGKTSIFQFFTALQYFETYRDESFGATFKREQSRDKFDEIYRLFGRDFQVEININNKTLNLILEEKESDILKLVIEEGNEEKLQLLQGLLNQFIFYLTPSKNVEGFKNIQVVNPFEESSDNAKHLNQIREDINSPVIKKIDIPSVTEYGETREGHEQMLLNMNQLSDGRKVLSRIDYYLDYLSYMATKKRVEIIVFFEEPETRLNPLLEKLVVEKINKLIFKHSNIQIFVITHSPFVIRKSLDETSNKTYLIDKGYTVDMRELPDHESVGYEKGNVITVVSKMLGAGIDDLAVNQDIEELNLIVCEGRNGETYSDAYLYTLIFPFDSSWRRNIFISTGGATEAISKYYGVKDISKAIFDNKTIVSVLIDRSCSKGKGVRINDKEFMKTDDEKPVFSLNQVRKFFEYSDKENYRVLNRKEIENYLYDPEVLLNAGVDKKIIAKFKKEVVDFSKEVRDKLSGYELPPIEELAITLSKMKNSNVYKELKGSIESQDWIKISKEI